MGQTITIHSDVAGSGSVKTVVTRICQEKDGKKAGGLHLKRPAWGGCAVFCAGLCFWQRTERRGNGNF